MTRNIEQYHQEYMADYGFEQVMVLYRRRLVLERIHHYHPKTVVEVGCGTELLYEEYLRLHGPVKKWVIVEPAAEFAAQARQAYLENAHVIEGFLEQVIDQVTEHFDGLPDMIVCSGLLHEVANADELLQQMIRLMNNNTVLHINVPNATSMHRRLAQSMGLIEDLKEMSARNQNLLQYRVYDLSSLVTDVEAAGLHTLDTGGSLVKPFTHQQMESISSITTHQVLDGLYELGRKYPDWASEIYLEAKRG